MPTIKRRTSKKQVIAYLKRKIAEYNGGCKERTYLIRALQVLKGELL